MGSAEAGRGLGVALRVQDVCLLGPMQAGDQQGCARAGLGMGGGRGQETRVVE